MAVKKKISVAPAKMSEKTLTDLVKNCLTAGGWMVSHFHDSRRQVKPGVFVGDKSAKGFPDIVAIKKGRLLVAELKSENGRFREGQTDWLNAFLATGAEVYVWRPRNWYNSAVENIAFDKVSFSQIQLNEEFYGAWKELVAP